ncbi:MAG: TonB C-terminal domain-containing protein [Alcaligenaceae bacterium]|nr:TonB C-terminal domain-containing protein [Alcaligenaceae bacterium]
MTSTLLLGRAKSLQSSAFFTIKTLVSSLTLSLVMINGLAHAQSKDLDPLSAEIKNSQLNDAIQQCARAKLHFAYRQENLTAHYAVTVDNDLHVSDAKITHPSGDKAFDHAVLNALTECPEYPEELRNSSFEGIFNYTR